jgi:O-antigen/teichoic acid export membrane protein
MNSNSQIKYGAVISYFSIGFNIIAGLLYTPWMIRQLGKSDYGLYVLATAFLTYFVMDFGLGLTIARFIAKYRAEGDEEKVNGLLGLTSKLYLFIDLLILVTLIVVYFFLGDIFVKLNPEEIDRFKVIFTIAGLFSILAFPFMSLNGILIAYERFTVLKLLDLLSKVALVALMIIFLLLGYGLFALVVINAGIGIGIIIIKLIYISKTTPIKVNILFSDRGLMKELLKFSVWITVIGVAQRLLMNITPTILGIFSGTEQIAIFSIGMTIEGYTWTLASALNGLFLAKVANLSLRQDNLKEVSDLMIKVGRIQLLIIGLLLVGFTTLGKEFITLWMGIDFKDSFYVALLLIAPGIITLTQEIGNAYLFVVNEIKYRAILSIAASIVSVLLSIALAPRFGAIGSAIAIFIGLISCHAIGMNILYWKVMKLDIPRFFRNCHIKLLIPIGLALLAGFVIQYFYKADSLINFFPKVLLLALIYVIIMWLMGMNSFEKQMVLSTIHRIRSKGK